MSIRDKVIEIAESRIGYYAPNDPLPGSEAGRFVADLWESFPNAQAAHDAGCANWEGGASWLRGPSYSIWWCCLFVSMCLWLAGARNVAGFPNYNCDNAKSKIRNAGSKYIWILPSKYDAQPGDIVLFDWGGDGACDHIGFVKRNNGPNSYVNTVEGNTSGSANGSQSAGNGVWPRSRPWSSINCAFRVNYEIMEEADMPLTDRDLQNIAAKVWEYAYGGDIGHTNMYNRLGEINSTTKSTAEAITNVLAELGVEVTEVGPKLYRLNKGEAHTYTPDDMTAEELERDGWTREGYLPMPEMEYIYEATNPYTGDCILTTSFNEVANLASNNWEPVGVVGVSTGDTPVYRLYNQYSGHHLYTEDESEREGLLARGWTDEGVAFKVQ